MGRRAARWVCRPGFSRVISSTAPCLRQFGPLKAGIEKRAKPGRCCLTLVDQELRVDVVMPWGLALPKVADSRLKFSSGEVSGHVSINTGCPGEGGQLNIGGRLREINWCQSQHGIPAPATITPTDQMWLQEIPVHVTLFLSISKFELL